MGCCYSHEQGPPAFENRGAFSFYDSSRNRSHSEHRTIVSGGVTEWPFAPQRVCVVEYSSTAFGRWNPVTPLRFANSTHGLMYGSTTTTTSSVIVWLCLLDSPYRDGSNSQSSAILFLPDVDVRNLRQVDEVADPVAVQRQEPFADGRPGDVDEHHR